ncbi:MAG: ATP-binding cassette domain-containing protein, partial [Actinobacteria bacterium]|nr:ATP-binding cassette domain-containing protein [Actinomycetota bacterium]
MPPVKGEPILEVRDLVKTFPVRTGLLRRVTSEVHAVSGVSFNVGAGETLGLVGESGCGKSTTARMVIRLLKPTSGTIRIKGRDVLTASGGDLRSLRQHMQIVFQDPYSA